MKPDNAIRNARIVAQIGRLSVRAIARKLKVSPGVVAGVIYRHQHRPAWRKETLRMRVRKALDDYVRGAQ